MTKKELKKKAIAEHNAKFEYDKANPKSDKELILQAFREVVSSIK